MFKLSKHNNKSDKSRDKFDFKFSSFQAIQVPKGWDKLFISLVSVETGRTISKLGKASVRNGTCRWTETLSEPVHMPQDDSNAKDLECCLFKFIVAMGSSRSGVLGEVAINLADYANSRSSVPLSLQLEKCNYSTSLQFKVQCLTPKIKYRDAQDKKTDLRVDYGSSDHDELETKSDASDGAFSRSVGSSCSNHLDSASILQVGNSRDPSLSASGSRRSFDSIEVSSGKDISSPQSNPGAGNFIGRQDSIDSQNSCPSYGASNDDNRSNHSHIHSRVPESSSPYGHKKEQMSSAFASSPLSNNGSSKDLLDAAEVKIEELRAEARMWERNAKKLIGDVDVLKEELSEQTKSQETLNMELSASHQECNGLKLEIEHLKCLLEESLKKIDARADLSLHTRDTNTMQREMEEEIGFLKESNADLTDQLQKTQESNVELLSILQELEGIVETQKSEIENLKDASATQMDLSCDSDIKETVGKTIQDLDAPFPDDIDNIKFQLQQLQETQEELERAIKLLEKTVEEKDSEIEMERELRTQSLLDSKTEWRSKIAKKDEEIVNLKAKLSETVEARQNEIIVDEFRGETELEREMQLLRGKVEDLEKECDELTQENLELLLKLKEPRNDSLSSDAVFSSSCGGPNDNSVCEYRNEATELRAQVQELKQELRKKEVLIEDAATSAQSQVQCRELEDKCADLELQLQSYKQKVTHLEDEVQKFDAIVRDQQVHFHKLQQQLEICKDKEMKAEDLDLSVPNVNSSSLCPNNLPHILQEMRKLLNYFLNHSKFHNQSLNFSVDPNTVCSFDVLELKCEEPLTWEEQLSATMDCLLKMNEFFESKCIYNTKEDVDEKLRHRDMFVNSNGHANCSSVEELAISNTVVSSDTIIKSEDNASETEALNYDETEVLRKELSTLQNQISSLREENHLLEESVESLERDKNTSLDCLEELKQEIDTLNSSVTSHVSAKKVLERLSSELERGKEDLEQQLSDLEKENMQLSERVSALEAQLRYLTNEKETCNLELRHSESQVTNLRDELRRLEIGMVAHKHDAKQKLQEMKNRWLEAQEECEYLKKANPKLQATAENLIEECSSLQKLNEQLKKQNIELHTCCSALESQLKDSHGKFTEWTGKIEALEVDFSTMLEEFSLKEKSLKSELDSLSIESREHQEKLMRENISINHMYSQKVVEVENLQKELAHLIDQISIAHDERESVSSDAILETSVLRSDKAKLEASLHELQEKLTLSESRLCNLQNESEAKVQELIALRQNQQVLMEDHDRLLVVLENLKGHEEKQRGIINGFEMKLKASDYERLHLRKEISSLNEQLQRTSLLQGEVLNMKSSLSDAKFQYEKTKASLDLVQGDHEELKIERDNLVQKISSMENALLGLDECQRSKVALEEKILRLEGDLAAREALCAQDAELKIELSRVKRANGELQRKIKHLEQDQKETADALRERLKHRKDEGSVSDLDSESNVVVASNGDAKQLLEISGEENTVYFSKIQTLENELAEALEANEMYKAQLRRFLSASENGSDVRKNGGNMSSLEMELRDLQERYFQMSLKYAEVEAQREELVLKLKTTNTRRSWFS